MNEIKVSAWHETGDLPPVGEKCLFKVGSFWKGAEIKGEAMDYGQRVVLVQVGDASKTVSNPNLFKPMLSDRDKAIAEIVNALSFPFDDSCIKLACSFAEQVYGAGYRKHGAPAVDLKSQLIATEVSLQNAEMWNGKLIEAVNDFIGLIHNHYVPGILQFEVMAMKAKELLDSMDQK